METHRPGTSLCEVLLALVVIAATTSWSLQAAAATARTLGDADGRRTAMQRARTALAELQALPCDSLAASRDANEARWQISAGRRTVGDETYDQVVLRSRRGDTIAIGRHRWCAQ